MVTKMDNGVTLLDLMLIVAVLGVLAVVGGPVYRSVFERGYCRHAQDLLLAIYTGERAYQMRNSSYLALTSTSGDDEWRKIHLDDPNESGGGVTFAVTTTCGADCFDATATKGSSQILSVDQDRTLTYSTTCPAP